MTAENIWSDTSDSGNGNGAFGLGWQSSVPRIARRTSKGLPLYEDADDPDVFIISGSEDLVPAFRKVSGNKLVRDRWGDLEYDIVTRDGYDIWRYRPRVDGLFARIECCTRCSDNVTSVYGIDKNSSIFDPCAVNGSRRRVFSWLVQQLRQ